MTNNRTCNMCSVNIDKLHGRRMICLDPECKRARNNLATKNCKANMKPKPNKVRKDSTPVFVPEERDRYKYQEDLSSSDKVIIKTSRDSYKEQGLTEEEIQAIYMECL